VFGRLHGPHQIECRSREGERVGIRDLKVHPSLHSRLDGMLLRQPGLLEAEGKSCSRARKRLRQVDQGPAMAAAHVQYMSARRKLQKIG
jgi:hypothetical protein